MGRFVREVSTSDSVEKIVINERIIKLAAERYIYFHLEYPA